MEPWVHPPSVGSAFEGVFDRERSARVLMRLILEDGGLETVEWAIVGGIITAVGTAIFLTIGADASRAMTLLDTATSLIP